MALGRLAQGVGSAPPVSGPESPHFVLEALQMPCVCEHVCLGLGQAGEEGMCMLQRALCVRRGCTEAPVGPSRKPQLQVPSPTSRSEREKQGL